MKLFLSVFFVLAADIFLLSDTCRSKEITGIQPDPLDISSQDSSVSTAVQFLFICQWRLVEKNRNPAFTVHLGLFFYSSRQFYLSFTPNPGFPHRLLPMLPKGSIAQQTGDLYVSGMDSPELKKKVSCL